MNHGFKLTNPRAFSVRPYQSVQDLIAMQSLLMAARAQTSDWRYLHVGELNFNFFMVQSHLDPGAHIRLWYNGDALVAFGLLGEDPSLDFQVLPDYAWRGIEEEIVAWAGARLAELRAENPAAWSGALLSGTRLDDTARIAFLERQGFRQDEYTEVNHILSLDGPIPVPSVPPSHTLRGLVIPDDIPDRAAVERDVWLPWSVGNVTAADYARFTQLPGYDPELDIVVVAPDGAIAAYVNAWLDPVNRIGDLGPVGARPAYRRQGLTRAALLGALQQMQARGMERACVSTGVNNIAARRLYESIGFRPVNNYLTYARPQGAKVDTP